MSRDQADPETMEEAALPLLRLSEALCASIYVWMGKGAREAASGPWSAVQAAMGLTWLEGTMVAYASTVSALCSDLMGACAVAGAAWAGPLAAEEGVALAATTLTSTVDASAAALVEEVTPTLSRLRLRLTDKRSVPIETAYRELLGEAHSMVMGGATEDAAIRKVLDQLLTRGGVRLERDGRSYDLYAYTRQRVMEAWRSEAQAERDRVGVALGLDGVEVSAHWNCAPDHQPYQGRVYSRVEMAAINAGLDRPIGKGVMNCRHILTPCHADSEPSYSGREREALIAEANAEVTVMGNKMTRYEATQWQRRQERLVRESKVNAMAARAAGDKELAERWDGVGRRAMARYEVGSDQAGLRVDHRRTTVGLLG